MNMSNKLIKQTAREKLLGRYGEHLSFSLALLILEAVCASIAGSFSQTTAMSAVFSIVVSAILQLLLSLFYAGASLHFMKQLRGEKGNFTDLIAPLKMHPDRFLIVGLIQIAVGFVLFSPVFFSGFIAGESVTPRALFLFDCIWLLIGSLLFLAVRAAFAMSTYLLLDHPDMEALPAIRTSLDMMKGQKIRFVLLLLSFIGYFMICAVTFGVGLVWVLPYLITSVAQFYLDLKKE